MDIALLPTAAPISEGHDFVKETFRLVGNRIVAIGDQMESLMDRIAGATSEERSEIERQQAILAAEHESIIPHWNDLQRLVALYTIEEDRHGGA